MGAHGETTEAALDAYLEEIAKEVLEDLVEQGKAVRSVDAEGRTVYKRPE